MVRVCGRCARQIEMGVQLEPAYQRIALAVFKFVALRQTAQAGAQAEALAFATAGKHADPGDHRGVGQAFHHAVHERVHILETTKDAGKAQ